MPSKRKLFAARLNGAKGGPKTPEGKARSSQNALTHGFCSEAVVLPSEDPEKFRQHRQALLDKFPGAEESTIEQLINDTWRIRRVWNIETTAIAESMEDVVPNLNKIYEEYSEDVRLYAGYRKLLKDSTLLMFLNRIEGRLARSIRLNLAKLEKSQNEPNYPQTGVFE